MRDRTECVRDKMKFTCPPPGGIPAHSGLHTERLVLQSLHSCPTFYRSSVQRTDADQKTKRLRTKLGAPIFVSPLWSVNFGLYEMLLCVCDILVACFLCVLPLFSPAPALHQLH